MIRITSILYKENGKTLNLLGRNVCEIFQKTVSHGFKTHSIDVNKCNFTAFAPISDAL